MPVSLKCPLTYAPQYILMCDNIMYLLEVDNGDNKGDMEDQKRLTS